MGYIKVLTNSSSGQFKVALPLPSQKRATLNAPYAKRYKPQQGE